MGTSRRQFLTIAGSFLAISGSMGSSALSAGEYMCPPCGCAGDKLSFNAPGNCPYCGMGLVPRADYEGSMHGKLGGAATSVDLPFELLANQIFLPVRVNGKGPFIFILDTGAPGTNVASEFASQLGIGAHAAEVEFTLAPQLVLTAVAGTVSLASSSPLIGRPIYGIIGADIIRQYVWRIDYFKKTITVFDPDRFVYAGTAPALPFAGLFFAYDPQADGTVKLRGRQPIPVTYTIDTGAGGTVISAPLVERYTMLSTVSRSLPMFGNVGGSADVTLAARIPQLQIGPYAVRNPIVLFSQDKNGVFAGESIGVNLGGSILKRFILTLDYLRSRFILEPNADFSQPFPWDASGLTFTTTSDYSAFVIQNVAAHTPGSDIGLQAGDLITSINGKPAREFAAWQLQDLFKQAGRSYSLTLERHGTILKRTIHLTQLL